VQQSLIMGSYSMRNKFVLSILFFGALISQFSYANDLKQLTLVEKVQNAELVIFGKVIEVGIERRKDGLLFKMARVEVEQTLKGVSLQQVQIQYFGPIHEANSNCCLAGERYLFFLEKSKDGILVLVNDKYGQYPLAIPETQR
jgi:hypothetical protein